MDENELYVEQMKHWFKEQRLLGKQIEGSILFHEEMAKVNRLQLDLNDKRIELARAEYNAWAEKNGFPMF